MTFRSFLFTFIISVLAATFVKAQGITQTLRGTIVDQHVQTPLFGATVMVVGTNPVIGATTDAQGNFKIEQVPVGTQTLKISYLGYEDKIVSNVIVNSGKETVLNIEMEESVIQGKEVVISANAHKERPLNEMSTVSARTFSVEETQKYAAAVNDPGRMVSSYAGVVSTDDGNNTISVRGNSPNGLLWRMEGMDIPNPNHFSSVGTSGGGISILSAQLLSNSDFLTGAFAADYGNALSGVFDLKLRKGNNERHEFTFKAGVLGLDFAAEGPFAKGYDGSYLINYRYSTLGVLTRLKVLDMASVTTFQDLSFNVFLPTKKMGNFTLFGFGGLSNQKQDGTKDSSAWKGALEKKYTEYFFANTGAAGATHSLILNSKAYLRSAFILTKTENGGRDSYFDNNYSTVPVDDQSYTQKQASASSTLSYKFSAKHLLRTGITFSNISYRLNQQLYVDSVKSLVQYINASGNTNLLQGFADWQFRPSNSLTFTTGVHYMQLLLNNTNSVEPRFAMRWDFAKRQAISLGYGLVGQIQPVGTYFSEVKDGEGKTLTPNKHLGFTRAHHIVLSYDYLLTSDFHIKTEAYYQALFNVPIDITTGSTYSILNQRDGFYAGPLQNKGTGRNYGIELTVEKFLSHHYYFLLSGSLYQSKYTGEDGIERNTMFNSNYANALTAGKDFELGKAKKRTLGLNTKILYVGGLRTSPVDLQKSIEQKDIAYVESKAFTIQNPTYFRLDVGVSLKGNHAKYTTTWQLDIQNVTNRRNIAGQYFDSNSNTIITLHLAPLIPILSYKIEF